MSDLTDGKKENATTPIRLLGRTTNSSTQPKQALTLTYDAIQDKSGLDIAILGGAEAPTYYRKVRKASSIVTYIGDNKTQGANDNDASWRVARILISGVETITEYADNAQFTQQFNDPASLFPTPILTNLYSTDFDGVNDYCSGGNIHNFDDTNAFSIGLYLKPDNVAAQRTLFAKATNDANVYGYVLYHTNTGALFLQMRAPGALRQHTFLTTLTAGVWQFIVLTFDGGGNISGVRVYKNAVVGDTPPAGSLNSWLSGQNWTLGSRNASFFFSGKIDSVSVWNKALTSAEVTELYNGGVVLDPTTHSTVINLVSWYRMGDGDVFPTIADNHGVFNLNMLNMTADDFVLDVP